MRRLWLLGLLLLSIGVGPGWTQGDTIVLKRGKPVRGRIWDRESDVVYNEFFTRIRRVTHGTHRVPAKKVKRVKAEPSPHFAFWREARELRDGTADQWVALGKRATSQKLKTLARFAFTEALVRKPAHAEARRLLGSAAKRVTGSDPRLNPDLAKKLAAFMAVPADDVAGADAAFKAVQSAGETRPRHYLERARRSQREKKGRTNDRVLTLRSKDHKGVYTLYVPQSYDPLRPTPLLVGLHGGGPAGKDRQGVVGSGRAAMGFFQNGAEQNGFLVVCPTALRAPWANPMNDGFLLTIVEEIGMLFNVDLNRTYLAGHSMGGFGTWHYGPKYAHLWAAIGPMAGGGRPNFKRLQDSLTGVYCYHGADDAVVTVGRDRRAGDTMRDRGMDFVYCEIPDSGHGFPRDVRAEMWDYFLPRLRGVTKSKNGRGKFTRAQGALSSFAAKPTKDEIRYFGRPGRPAAPADLKTLLADLVSGGGLGEKAARALAKHHKNVKTARLVAKVLLNAKNGADTRKWAAWTLGEMQQTQTVKALQRGLRDEDLNVMGASVRALGRVPVPASSKMKIVGKAARDLVARFQGRRTGGRFDFTDFRNHASVATSFAVGVKGLADASLTGTLNLLARTFILDSIEVRTSRRVGQSTVPSRRNLGRALIEAYRAAPSAAARAVVEELAQRSDLGIETEAAELLESLPAER